MSQDSPNLDHTPNPYAHRCQDFDTVVRPFLVEYLPPLVNVLTFTWDLEDGLSGAYLAQCMVLASNECGSLDVKTNMRALAWELADHVRAFNAISPLREPQIPEEAERCRCGMDHKLEATALAAFLERAIAGDNASSVKVLDALWRDMSADEPQEALHVGSSLLSHVVGGMVFARLHQDCDHDHHL